MRQRIDVCRHYICEGSCALGKKGTYFKYCQHCNMYNPRFVSKHENRKISALKRILERDFYREKSVIS